MGRAMLIGHWKRFTRSSIFLTLGFALSAEAPTISFDQTLAVAITNLSQVAVRDGRGSLARDLAVTLLSKKRCDQAIGLLQANPDALTTNADQVARAAVRYGDTGCLIAVATVLAKTEPSVDELLSSTAPEAHHLAGALLTVAGRSEGAAAIRRAEVAMAAPPPSLPPLPETAPPRLRALIEGLQLRQRMQEKLSGRTLADERVWDARITELSIYDSSGQPDGRYAMALDRYAAAALAAGSKVPAGALDDLATRCLKLGRRDRAAVLMDAAVRNEDNPNTEHSLASREFDVLLEKGKYTEAAALIYTIDPAKAPVLIDVALTEIMFDQPVILLPYQSAFDRWSDSQPARAAAWFSELALQLASHGETADARATLANSLHRLEKAKSDEEWSAAQTTAVQAAALLGNDNAAWSLASTSRADHDSYVGLVSAIALGALNAGRDASADRALAQLSKEEQGYVYERALGGAFRASVKARQRIIERALAFAGKAEVLQARRIYASLAQEAASQLDLPDIVATILSAALPAQRGSLAVDAAFHAFVSAEVAREKGQPGPETEGRHRGSVLAQTALKELSNLSDEDKVKLSQQLCTGLSDLASSRRVADAITDPYKREQAYLTLIARTPLRS